MSVLLPKGHKIGKPSPLFTKLENDFIHEMRLKYSGGQDTKKTEENKPSPVKITGIKELEEAVRLQADKVRQLKSANTKDKSVWQPEVNILLDLKKQLEAANNSSLNEKNCSNKDQIADLQQQIAKK